MLCRQLAALKAAVAAPYKNSPRKLWINYGIDWGLIVLFVVAIGLLELLVAPFDRKFELGDPSLSMPFKEHETVPFGALVATQLGVAVVVFCVCSARLRSFHDLHMASFGILQAFALVGVITEIVKFSAGRYRPDWYARCVPVQDATTGSVICTGETHLLKDGRLSFFSGHTSVAFALSGFLSLYLAGKLRVVGQRSHFWCASIVCAPLVAALWVGISRTMDYRHHWEDGWTGSGSGDISATLPQPFHPPLGT